MEKPAHGTDQKFAPAMMMSLSATIPFIGCAVALLVLGKENDLSSSLEEMFKTWSAIILAFIGGIRWCSAVFSKTESLNKMSASTFLPVAGWLALFVSGPFSVLILLLIYCAQGAWDSFSNRMSDEPGWYTTVRILFTLMVVACHMMVFIAIY